MGNRRQVPKAEEDPPNNRVRTIDIDAAADGRRLDNFLTSVLGRVPKSLIYRIIRRGEVRVNGGRARPDRKLRAGDRVRVPPVRLPTATAPLIGDGQLERVRQAIIYDDADLMVLDKPAGLAVHTGSGLAFGVIDVLRRLHPEYPDIELAHRLDRDTSGCLVIAKHYRALRDVQRQLGTASAQKTYLGLLGGTLVANERRIELSLSTTRRGGEKWTAVDPAGKSATSVVRALERFQDYTYAEIGITTGRTHQIRTHTAAIGHALVGDRKYGVAAANDRARALGLKRLFLHAHRVTLQVAGRSVPLVIEAPLPRELDEFLCVIR